MIRLLLISAAVALGITAAVAQTGSSKTNGSLNSEVNTNFPDNTSGAITPAIARQMFLDMITSLGSLTTSNQVLTGGGATVLTVNNGIKSSGTFTVNCGLGPFQSFTNGGAFTLAAPVLDGGCDLLDVNNGSAGAITLSGFTTAGSTGDALTTTTASTFIIHVESISAVATYSIKNIK
jgi:hypothetical protein